MLFKRGWVVLPAAFALIFIVPTVSASVVTLSTADNPINPGSNNSGWWSDSRASSTGNDNYFTGFLRSTPNTMHGYFTFDIPNLIGHVSAATLSIRLGNNGSPDRVETLGFFDVSTPATDLAARGFVDTAIFDDLGSGALYGTTQVVIGSSSTTILQIPLNQTALNDINANLGDFFSIGSSLLTLGQTSVDEQVFGFSAGFTNHLTLTVIPEPATGLMLLGLFALTGRRRA